MSGTHTNLRIRLSKLKTYFKMLGKRAKKYFFFILGLCFLSLFPGNRQRGKLVQLVYSCMRDIDDVVDFDEPLPTEYESTMDFVDGKIAFIDNPQNPRDDIDMKIKISLELADSMGLDIRYGLKCILRSMRFDSLRQGKKMIFPKSELDQHFHLLDVVGTVKESLQLYGEDAITLTPIVGLLGMASRIYYNLRDFESEDIPSGLINVTSEDFDRFHISANNLTISSPAVQMWFKDQAMEGLALIREYKKDMVGKRIRLITWLTLRLAFERPAKKYLKKILTEPTWE